MRNRAITCLVATGLLVTAAAACSSDGGSEGASADSGESTQEPIIVGLIDEQTGPTASVQGAAGDGVRLAVEEINDAGGIEGRRIELLERDTAGDAAQAVQGITEMVDEGAVAIVGPVNGGLCQAAAPTFAKLDVPGFCLSPVDLPAETSHMYGIGLELAQEDEYVFDLLGEENGKIGILAQQTPVLDLVKSHVERFAGDYDVQIEEIDPTATRAKPQMEALVDGEVGGILLAPCGPLSVSAAQDAIDLGFEGPIFVWNCFASDEAAAAFAEVANGNIWTVAPTFILGNAAEDDPQLPAIEAYEEAGGPADIVAAAGWDGMQLLADVIAESDADPEAIREALDAGFSYDGVWSAGTITAEDHRGVRTEGAMQLVAFTPEGTMEIIEGS